MMVVLDYPVPWCRTVWRLPTDFDNDVDDDDDDYDDDDDDHDDDDDDYDDDDNDDSVKLPSALM